MGFSLPRQTHLLLLLRVYGNRLQTVRFLFLLHFVGPMQAFTAAFHNQAKSAIFWEIFKYAFFANELEYSHGCKLPKARTSTIVDGSGIFKRCSVTSQDKDSQFLWINVIKYLWFTFNSVRDLLGNHQIDKKYFTAEFPLQKFYEM